jgi:hypothetical protein
MTRQFDAWGAGPWDDEPDEHYWVAHGLKCRILRAGQGHLCGYVEDRYGVFADDLPEEITIGSREWIGFDCNHYAGGDANPQDMAQDPHHPGTYKTFEEVKQRTEVLARAIRVRTRWWRRWLRALSVWLENLADDRPRPKRCRT